jgi:hypothetical protein
MWVPAKITEFAVEPHYSPLPRRVKVDIISVSLFEIMPYSDRSEIDQNPSTCPLQAA